MGKPDCPRCANNRQTYPVGDGLWRCRRCSAEFDPEDDGDFGYGDPAKQVEHKELRQIAIRERTKARKARGLRR